MAFRGERFVVDFSDEEDEEEQKIPPAFDFVGDIQERSPSAPTPPAPPQQLSFTSTGFPEHRKRNKQSAFKRQREGQEAGTGAGATVTPPSAGAANTKLSTTKQELEQDEKRAIEEENKTRLAAMSPAQIKNEREELMSSLPPSLLERFLKRATIDDGHEGDVVPTEKEVIDAAAVQQKEDEKSKKSVSFDVSPSEDVDHSKSQQAVQKDSQPLSQPTHSFDIDSRAPKQPPEELYPVSEPPTGSVHFPRPPRDAPMPNLDPSSPSFLSDLQTHYFPDTPHDPSSLAWMQPSTDPSSDAPSDSTSAYHPDSSATAVAPASLRFSLTGTLLAPHTSLSLPRTLGLHHHASDPEAAGYTIPELAILSRSTVPSQRCLAWQILGRLLFRLGRGEFGERGSDLVEGLWATVERENVVAGMLAEAGGNSGKGPGGIGRHASATAWATEAVWLWRRGGGGDRGLLKEGTVRSK